MTAKPIFQADASNPIVRAVVRSVSAANNGRYRLYYVPGYRSFMYLNLSEPLALRRLLGRYERPKMDFLRRHLVEGAAFVDVGASLGDYSLVASRLVGPRGKVIAFEPDPVNCRWLRKSIERNGLTNVELYQEALSDVEGEASFFLSGVSGWHTLKKGQLAAEKGEIKVRTRPLDDVDLPRLDVMKIDVEGAELEVLEGARRHLRRFRPLLFVDLHPMMGADVPAVVRFLRDAGYELRSFESDGAIRPYRSDDGELVAIPMARVMRTA